MAYSDKVVDHFNNPRNMGSFKKDEEGVGTGMVGATNSPGSSRKCVARPASPRLTCRPYIIIPESPHYPGSRSDVPHPHVLGERLCEGDASAPLAHALRTGRFSDYFQIIQQTLASYNSESPYVSLSAWYGANCHACGDHVSDDAESYYCEDCEATVCAGCSRACDHCGHSGCDACLPNCPACGSGNCSSCLKRCDGCSKLRCPDCLTNSLCEECHAATDPDEETTDEKVSDSDATTMPDAPLSSDGVGQALVPA